ncbi:MAG: UPF0182 family protein [Candidatus Anoxymicrobium japonicum]|uniref:UPF0182 protein CVT63_05805 n=1 Tax=Candidatus Anoxymicrobium japonicum TaxID=2013648 RepID=A0A2N3G5I8_9ACTN|nr:MAG: UPF0182 family protein [Candidatus Anoxymicrobium japonicum]
MSVGPQNIEDFSKRLQELRDSGAAGLREQLKGKFTRGRITLLALVFLLLFIVLVIEPLSKFYTDALWYNHVGFQNLFYKTLVAKILSVVAFSLAFFVLLYGNIFLARKISPEQKFELAGSPLEEIIEKAKGAWKKLVSVGLVIFSGVAALIAGSGWGGKWDIILKWLNPSAFNKTDPVFGKDIGYYVFSYPFHRALADWLIGAFMFVLVVTAIIYVFEGGIRLKGGWDMFSSHVLAHLSVLMAAVFVVKAYSYRLNMYELLFSKGGVVYGVGYADARALIPALWVMLALALGAAVVLLVNVRARSWLLPVIVVGSLIVVALLGGTIYPAIVQSWRVKPAESSREKPYLKRHIDATRDAYKINNVQTKDYPAEYNLNDTVIQKNRATIQNIRLWDPRPILNTFGQMQSIRQYYKFNDVDVDRYTVNNDYRQTMISAREMVQEQLPESARTWVNDTLVYTHGYGAVMSPSNDVTSEGNPDFIIKDIPPAGPTNIQIKTPQIYFGELSNDYVVTNTTEREFDRPQGDKEVRAVYKGTGGIKVKSFWRKLLYSIRFRDVNLILSGQVRGKSQIMYYRSISNRISKCAPFLKVDGDPYLVVTDAGKLVWVVDCYTTTDKYPYSEPTAGMGNYVRNSVKAVIDAYEGDVSLYVIDSSDPVVETYQKIFPQIFKPFDAMPPDIKKHLRYPEDLFLAQANVLQTFHMVSPNQFYNREDQWDFPQEQYNNQRQMMQPYYIILKLPGESSEEMVLLIPFAPHNKQNMISWLGARMDNGHYGELVNFIFPSGKLIYGPEQVEGRIEQDPEISKQLSLWRQAGSEVIRGNLLVIPIEGSLLYVEPLYLQATQIKIPQVKRVIVVYNQNVIMEDSLDKAVLRAFGAAPPPSTTSKTPVTPSPAMQSLATQALDLYNKAVDAQKSGDWAGYGNILNQLSGVLKQLAQQAK